MREKEEPSKLRHSRSPAEEPLASKGRRQRFFSCRRIWIRLASQPLRLGRGRLFVLLGRLAKVNAKKPAPASATGEEGPKIAREASPASLSARQAPPERVYFLPP